MAWLSSFLLGRPGFEFSFEVNPMAMTIQDAPVAVLQRNLVGDMKKSVLKTTAPIIRINSNYLTIGQRNQFASLAGIAETFLSFQIRDDLQVVAERNLPVDTTHVKIQNNSITRLSAALVAAGFPGIITINSVNTIPNVTGGNPFGSGGFGDAGFQGSDYFSSGSYDDATRIITLGSTLPSASAYCYVSYTYKGWLVNMDVFNHTVQAGWVDRFQYDFQLTGA